MVGELRSSASRFVGRRDELATITRRLRAASLVTVLGIGGLGKTRVAMEIAARWPSGHVFVDLTNARDRASLLDALGEALAPGTSTLASAASAEKRLTLALARRGPCLVVVDNFEQLVDEAALLAQLVADVPAARFLVTSRERLRLSIESVVELAPLDAADELFLDRMLARRPEFVPSDEERRAITSIVEALDGIPLAIELAVERAATLGVAALAAGNPACASALGPRDLPARHRTMQAALEGSWERLAPKERSVLAVCALVRGALQPADVVAMASTIVGGDERVLVALQELRDKSLLTGDVDARGLRRVFGVIREFVLARLEPATRADLAARHAAHFATKAGAERSLHWVVAAWDDVVAAFDLLVVDDPDRACQLLLLVGETALRGGRVAVLLERCDRALLLPDVPASMLAQLLVLRSRSCRRCGRLDDADRDLDEAIRMVSESGDAHLHARMLRQRSLRLARSARLDEALASFEEANRLHDPSRDLGGDAYEVLGLSSALRQNGDAMRARTVLETYLAGDIGNGDRALALLELALAHVDAGASQAVGATARAARDIARKLGWLAEEARAELFLALAAFHVDRADVEPRLRRVIALSERAGGTSAAAYARGYLGVHYFELGRLDDASAELVAAVPPDGGHRALFAAYRASVAAAAGDLSLARAIAVETRREDIPPALEAPIRIHEVHLALAEVRMTWPSLPAPSAEAIGRAVARLASVSECVDLDTVLAARIAQRALGALEVTAPSLRVVPLEVHERGDWFALDGSERVDLTLHVNAKRALAVLAAQRVLAPGERVPEAVLVAQIWQGETIQETASRNRLRVTMAHLRKVGLREVILNEDHGYLISEWVAVRTVAEPPSEAGCRPSRALGSARPRVVRGRAGSA